MTKTQLPYPLVLSVYRGAAVTGRTSGTQYTVVFDTEEIDAGGTFNSSTGEWTPLRGVYLASCSVALYSDTTTQFTRVLPVLKKDGTDHRYFGQLDHGTSLVNFYQYYPAGVFPIIANGAEVFRIDVTAWTGTGTWSYGGGLAYTYFSAVQVQ